jgi:site-specific DNA-methyltransferase (adenine-specific)
MTFDLTTRILHGDCLELLKQLPDNSVDSIVTDPPYGLAFMGKKWDYDIPSVEIWIECLRVLKYGGHLLAFAGTRTQHRMAVRIEDAGFEIRDMIAWVYGSGFPKSLNIGKAVDKLMGNEREVMGNERSGKSSRAYQSEEQTTAGEYDLTKGTSEWEGWGTALKPALEPITVARKPLSEKTVAENVLKWRTGGINIDGCRVGTEGARNNGCKANDEGYAKNQIYGKYKPTKKIEYNMGRFPANLIHDGSDEVVSLFPNTTSGLLSPHHNIGNNGIDKFSVNKYKDHTFKDYGGDSGSASRFLYTAKASKSERGKDNTHPTVKPLKLMQYLVRLVTPKDGIVLDPFGGSGTTAVAAIEEDKDFIIMERETEYIAKIHKRVKKALNKPRQTTLFDFIGTGIAER